MGLLIERSRLKKILSIAVPIILGMISQNLLNLVDTAFVGRLGSTELAAVGMGGFANWLLVSFLLGLGSGVQATAARRLGEGRMGETASGLKSALVLGTSIGIPAAVLGYAFAPEIFSFLVDDTAVVEAGAGYLAARFVGAPFAAANVAFRGFWNGINRSMQYLTTLVVMHVVNIVLDYGLIFGKLGMPEMGVAGAGYATSISLVVGTLTYILLAIFKARDSGFLQLKGTLDSMSSIVRLSAPAGLQNFLFSAGFVTFFIIAGSVGTRTLAASNVLINLAMVCVLPGLGIGLAGASLVGQALGRKDVEDARRWGWEVTRFGAFWMGVMGLVLSLGNRLWLGIFIVDDPETLELAVLPLIILGLGQWLDGIGVVLNNVLVGVGDTIAALLMGLFSQWVLFLPLAWFFAVEMEFGILALWVGMLGYRIVLSGLALWRFKSGAWARARV